VRHTHMSVGKRAIGNRRSVIGVGQLGCEQTSSTEKDNSMASPAKFRTPYEIRIQLVADTIKAHSKLDNDAAGRLAVHVLHALNSIPEKMR
jgi:hypothetical protein